MLNEDSVVRIKYKNYRGEVGFRDILPKKIWYGSTDWHKDEQWLLDAIDLKKDALRNFAIKDILEWSNRNSLGS